MEFLAISNGIPCPCHGYYPWQGQGIQGYSKCVAGVSRNKKDKKTKRHEDKKTQMAGIEI